MQPMVDNAHGSSGHVTFSNEVVQMEANSATLLRDPKSAASTESKRNSRLSVITSTISKSFKRSTTNDSDVKVWIADIDGRQVTCAKINNAVVLTRPGSDVWIKTAGVQRLEIEDTDRAFHSSTPKQLCNELPHLESFSLTWANISGFPPRFFQLPLTHLYLQRNNIKGIDGLEQATHLTVLDVSDNVLKSLPQNFGHLANLETLNIAGNIITELPESVGSLRKLRTLNCSHNRLESLPNSLGNVTELISLDISNNQLRNFPTTFGHLVKLTDLRSQNNELRSLPETFGQLHQLSSLLLGKNHFQRVPPQLASLTSLATLNMSDNRIEHMDKPITSLKYLVLDQNDFAEIDVAILQCAKLHLLSIKRNRLCHVPDSIGQVTHLQSLFLSNNPIAHVPVQVSQLSGLLHLSLSSTNLQTIPLAVASLPLLHTLDLDDCTELNQPLRDAYMTGGRVGVIDYLQQPDTVTETATQAEKPSNSVAVRPYPTNTIRSLVTESIIPNNAPYGTSCPENLNHAGLPNLSATGSSEANSNSRHVADIWAGSTTSSPQQATANARPDKPPKPTTKPATKL